MSDMKSSPVMWDLIANFVVDGHSEIADAQPVQQRRRSSADCPWVRPMKAGVAPNGLISTASAMKILANSMRCTPGGPEECSPPLSRAAQTTLPPGRAANRRLRGGRSRLAFLW